MKNAIASNKKKYLAPLLVAISLLVNQTASAKCGGVDYSWGADALARL